jgi:hypothetical protein
MPLAVRLAALLTHFSQQLFYGSLASGYVAPGIGPLTAGGGRSQVIRSLRWREHPFPTYPASELCSIYKSRRTVAPTSPQPKRDQLAVTLPMCPRA